MKPQNLQLPDSVSHELLFSVNDFYQFRQISDWSLEALEEDKMAGAVSALFLLDIKGRVLVWRDYRGDVSAKQAERFFTKLIEKDVISIHLFSRFPLPN